MLTGRAGITSLHPFRLAPRSRAPHSTRAAGEIPVGWSVAAGDRKWIGHVLFEEQRYPTPCATGFYYQPNPLETQAPMPGDFFRRRLFIWMPRRQWEFPFHCPHYPDNQSLTSKGFYRHLREVVDFQEMFYLASEHLECPLCKTSIIAWDERVLEQLPTKYREQFCVLLTRKYAIYKPVLRQLHARRKGNTPTALMEILNENHTEKWTDRCFAYPTA